jgi:hypothetical protein
MGQLRPAIGILVQSRWLVAVQPLPQLLAGLEEWNHLPIDTDGFACAGIAPDPWLPLLNGKGSKATEFNPGAARQRVADFVENRGNDLFNITLVQVRMFLRKADNQFRLCHFGPSETATLDDTRRLQE